MNKIPLGKPYLKTDVILDEVKKVLKLLVSIAKKSFEDK